MAVPYPSHWSRFFHLPFGVFFPGFEHDSALSVTARQKWELDTLVSALPAAVREEAAWLFWETLRFRVRWCWPLPPPEELEEHTRFGLVGELVRDLAYLVLRALLRKDLTAVLRILESDQSRTERNRLLALHRARLGQLYWALGRWGDVDPLEELRNGLVVLWA
jgi:hypothetical protein